MFAIKLEFQCTPFQELKFSTREFMFCLEVYQKDDIPLNITHFVTLWKPQRNNYSTMALKLTIVINHKITNSTKAIK